MRGQIIIVINIVLDYEVIFMFVRSKARIHR